MPKLPSGLASLKSLLTREPPGSSPGRLSVLPDTPSETRIVVLAYGEEGFIEREIADLDEIKQLIERWPVVWIDVDGVGDLAKLEAIASALSLHPLAMEDAVCGNQRPKVELYPEHLFMVLRMISLEDRVRTEQLSIFLTKNVVVTLQGERPGDCLDPVRTRVRTARSRHRSRRADYLAYSIVDAVVDNYFPVLEDFGERLEQLEEEVLVRVNKGDAPRIQAMKHDLFTVRRSVWPTRDAIGVAHREENAFLAAETQIYLRDVYDHVTQLGDVLDTYREVTSGLMELHLSAASNRLNEIMKFLTVISMVFIPLNFIAGVYGMNFDSSRSALNMPELGWYYGYPWALGLMLSTAVLLLLFFRRKGFFD